MDMTDSLTPKSDQLDNVELAAGPRTFTIESVSTGSEQQPFNFHLVGFPRAWRPGITMRRLITTAWGPKTDKYVGQQVTLYCDPTVTMGKDITGGTRISHMSGLTKPLKRSLQVSRGKWEMFTVQPLKVAPSRDWFAELTIAGMDRDAIGALGQAAKAAGTDEKIMAAIRAAYNAAEVL
jgi:hypothetical protein